MEKIRYTTVYHDFRRKNKLSALEYIFCDTVYKLCYNSKNTHGNWCYMSRTCMADELGISKQAVISMIERLEERGFVHKHPETKFLQTTEKWEKVYFSDQKDGGQETLPSVKKLDRGGKETLPHGGKETLPYNSNIDNSIYKNNKGRKKKSEIQIEVAPIISKHTKPPLITMFEHWKRAFPNYLESQNDDMPALRKICHFFTKREPIHVDAAELDTMMQNFTEIIRRHNFYNSRSLKTIANNLQSIMMDETNRKAQEQEEEKSKRLVLNDGQVNGYQESKGVKIRI